MKECTVIINTFNEIPERLQATTNSFLNQKNTDPQIVISTVADDPSLKYCGSSCNVITSPKGIYSQLNRAIQLVETDWWCYSSGNDIAHPDKIRSEIDCCLRKKKLVCYSDYVKVSPSGERQHVKFPEYNFDKHLKGNFVNDCSMIHKSLLKYAPFQFEQWGNLSHWDFWLRIYKGEGDVFCHNPIPTWDYIQHKNSQHILRTAEQEKQMQLLRNKLYDEHRTRRELLR